MVKKRQLFCLLLAGFMCLTICGCKKNDKNSEIIIDKTENSAKEKYIGNEEMDVEVTEELQKDSDRVETKTEETNEEHLIPKIEVEEDTTSIEEEIEAYPDVPSESSNDSGNGVETMPEWNENAWAGGEIGL